MPKISGKSGNESLIKLCESQSKKALSTLDSHYLNNTKFISSNEISIADLQAICELTQYWMIGEPMETGFPNIARWMKDCQAELKPHFDDVHKYVYFARDSNFFNSSKL